MPLGCSRPSVTRCCSTQPGRLDEPQLSVHHHVGPAPPRDIHRGQLQIPPHIVNLRRLGAGRVWCGQVLLFELLRQLVGGSPIGFLVDGFTVVLLVAVTAYAPVFKLEAKAWFLRRRGVTKKQLADWALAEAKKDRQNPLVEIINALRRQPP